MTIAKEKIQNIVDHMPDAIQVDDLIERIVLLQKIETARQQFKDGHIITEDEMDQFIDSLE